MSGSRWQWENATAGAVAGFATVAAMHPLDVIRTRFQANDGRVSNLPTYNNTAQALLAIARHEGFRGLYAGFYPAVFRSSVSWGLYFFFYGRAKERYSARREGALSPGLHLASAAEAGALFTFYEELRKIILQLKSQGKDAKPESMDKILNSFDYAGLGASSKLVAILLTYPCQVIRTRLQQRPGNDGNPRYMDSWHVIKEAVRFEGIRGFYKGITANILKNVPASSVTFIVYENVMDFLRNAGRTKS